MFHVKPEIEPDDLQEIFKTGLNLLGLNLTEKITADILAYFHLLLQANKRFNLISAQQSLPTQVAVHLLDSLTPLLYPDWPQTQSVLDIGSGGGLPALPLSLAFPAWSVTLAEATGKKAAFLAEVKTTLALERVTILNQFLNPGQNKENKFYDLVTARAVSNLETLAALAGPRLNRGGFLLAFKGPRGQAEFSGAKKELTKWNLKLTRRLDLSLPLVGFQRSLYFFQRG
jgi:16S rRNA (guanine527-N7)-methyltransferase